MLSLLDSLLSSRDGVLLPLLLVEETSLLQLLPLLLPLLLQTGLPEVVLPWSGDDGSESSESRDDWL